MKVYPLSSSILPLIISLDTDAIMNLENVPEFDDNSTRCGLCNAFFNSYAIIHDHPSVWKCALCNRVNTLPLPPSNSFDTGFSLAQKSIPYNNIVFDFIKQPRNHKNQKPCIILAVISSLNRQIIDKISEGIDDSLEIDYILIYFNAYVEIFDTQSNSFKVLLCESSDIFLPTSVDRMKMNSTKLKNVLKSYIPPARSDSNLSPLCAIVNEINLEEPTRFVCFAKGPVQTMSSQIQYPTYLCFIGDSINKLGYFNSLINVPGSKFTIIDDSDLSKVLFFSQKCFRTKIVKDIQIQFYMPKTMFQSNVSPNSRIAAFERSNFSGAVLFSIAQAELGYTEVNEKNVKRIISIKIPLTPHAKIYKSSTFKFPYRCLFSVCSYIIEEIKKMTETQQLFQIRGFIFETAQRYPHELLFKNFIFSLFRSKLLDQGADLYTRSGIAHMLCTLPIPNIFFYFVPLEYVNGKIEPVIPKPNKDAIARLTHDAVYILDSVEDPKSIVNSIAKAMDLLYIDSCIEIVPKLQEINDYTEGYRQWESAWSKNTPKFNFTTV
ncbi:hypothetical protein TVAG_469040 [Trichomonas vaginalis G3]|uniref:Zinc finger Sec23/Sec24-type domain-containing protein n=1 Tax=Trichomonas vaginalis (strain ATCC PRA-98 / G3) TaxID=412133 RepID=A2FD75_TRIV3|nr:SEC24-related protein family [Trichomonas vaginalis G3]EAX97131.1 hypothetical protein TVAG_469040 [Trichomonas vaginalis G3]KAI5549244.1 SEC24-related protein family [Trichomonas vaginalis G3]|eukprot:XP_001310061.1 hypothetical protein [Trichomonas vaginalis G3]